MHIYVYIYLRWRNSSIFQLVSIIYQRKKQNSVGEHQKMGRIMLWRDEKESVDTGFYRIWAVYNQQYKTERKEKSGLLASRQQLQRTHNGLDKNSKYSVKKSSKSNLLGLNFRVCKN